MLLPAAESGGELLDGDGTLAGDDSSLFWRGEAESTSSDGESHAWVSLEAAAVAEESKKTKEADSSAAVAVVAESSGDVSTRETKAEERESRTDESDSV
jgi:hypothetical protein